MFSLASMSDEENVALIAGGMRVLNTNFGQTQHGVFTQKPEALTNDFFVNLLDMGTEWKTVSDAKDIFEGRDRKTGEVKWTGTRVRSHLRFELPAPRSGRGLRKRGCAEDVCPGLRGGLDQVMNLDRFDLA